MTNNLKNKDKINAYNREYYHKNKEKIKAIQKKYFNKNIEKIKIRKKKYNDANRDRINAHNRENYHKNKEKRRAHYKEHYHKDIEKSRAYYRERYRKNRDRLLEKDRQYREKNPWMSHYYSAYSRCNNPKRDNYKYYGGRGIKMLMTSDDFKFLWFRDQACLLKKPSIDRKDNDGHYELINCCFIEHGENSKKEKIMRINK